MAGATSMADAAVTQPQREGDTWLEQQYGKCSCNTAVTQPQREGDLPPSTKMWILNNKLPRVP